MAEVVVDASAMVDLLLDNELGSAVRLRLAGHALHAPAHLDAEVLSALGRLHRAGDLEAEAVESKLRDLVAAPIQRHGVGELVIGAWSRRHQLRLVDALYVQLAIVRDLRLVTTDRRLRAMPSADVVTT
ncbi:type II toxin-antitoxin system VapC family toxin [Nakamurella sp. PAMC28650]|uniref:type II toxin-antitoxin system VapC family toxin n=1 Tax=Nakamurella sp. PAMC28650 TaxID=2762325 RepID=UPI00164E89F2|nr:type II toxin-antitoxin system VapC family toxin [Nakamurella sp. PAMC28650]QNK82858.1 type II toxin-antitoxin system VapC family toxin [Nakamurella sp. PAMC28650]